MMRIWDRFLSAQDREHLAATPPPTAVGFGVRPALVLIDNYAGPIAPEGLSLLDAVAQNPSAIGPTAWDALRAQKTLLDVARSKDIPVIHVTRLADGNLPEWSYCLKGPELRGTLRGPVLMRDKESKIVDMVAPTEREFVVRKIAPSAFFGSPLIGLLNFLAIDTLIVGGESTSGCVRATVVDAVAYRYRVTVVEECTYDRHEASHAINLFDMNQKYADVLGLAEVLAYLRHHDDAEAVTRT